MMRLNKFMAQAGIASRRKCDDLILEGRVKVNGEVIDRVGVVIDEKKDVVLFNGRRIRLDQSYIYVLLNKPRGVVTTAKDEYRRSTVIDLIGIPERIYPVGRLDYETTGILLLTNDGELTNYLLHPNHKTEKIYRVTLNRVIKPVDLHHLRAGVELEGKKTQPCVINELRVVDNCSYLEVKLREGRNRQIRRMFELFNYTVEELERISFAGLQAGDLKPGEWRYLTKEEIARLKERIKHAT